MRDNERWRKSVSEQLQQAQPTTTEEENPPPSHTITCPVDGCGWKYEAGPVPVVDPMLMAGIFGVGTMASSATYAHQTDVESALHKHFTGHTTVEFIRTITRLQQ